MGTNFYLHKKKPGDLIGCPACGHAFRHATLIDKEPLHIGKSSVGWTFALRVYPFEQQGDDAQFDGYDLPENLEEWKALFEADCFEIRDEYDRVWTTEKMLDNILNRRRPDGVDRNGGPPLYYESWDSFYKANDAMPGPNNLLRRKLGAGSGCIGHGNGTYDLIAREFC